MGRDAYYIFTLHLLKVPQLLLEWYLSSRFCALFCMFIFLGMCLCIALGLRKIFVDAVDNVHMWARCAFGAIVGTMLFPYYVGIGMRSRSNIRGLGYPATKTTDLRWCVIPMSLLELLINALSKLYGKHYVWFVIMLVVLWRPIKESTPYQSSLLMWKAYARKQCTQREGRFHCNVYSLAQMNLGACSSHIHCSLLLFSSNSLPNMVSWNSLVSRWLELYVTYLTVILGLWYVEGFIMLLYSLGSYQKKNEANTKGKKFIHSNP